MVRLPDWGIRRVRAKADTGAQTTALDVAELTELDEGRRVRFDVIRSRKYPDRRMTVEAEVVRRASVRSAHGTLDDRIIVRTTIELGSIRKEVDIGLVCRKRMLCRMLIGRTALEPEFLVDPSRRYVLGDGRGRPGGRKKKKSRKSSSPPSPHDGQLEGPQ